MEYDNRKIRFLGQELSIGTKWFGYTMLSNSDYCKTEFHGTSGLSYGKVANTWDVFMSVGTGFSLWDWYLENIGSTYPVNDALYLFDSVGRLSDARILARDPFSFAIKIWHEPLANNGCFILAKCFNTVGDHYNTVNDSRYWTQIALSQIISFSYNGVTSFPLSQRDKEIASYYLFAPQMYFEPDMTYSTASGVQDMSTVFAGFMNGEAIQISARDSDPAYIDWASQQSEAMPTEYHNDFGHDFSCCTEAFESIYTGIDPPEQGYIQGCFTIGLYMVPELKYMYRTNTNTIIGQLQYTSDNRWYPWECLPEFSEITDFSEDFEQDTKTGGDGEYVIKGNPVGPDSLPDKGPSDTGLVHLYLPTGNQMDAITDYMWSDDFVDNLKKLVNDPMDAVISLVYLPVNLSSVRGQTAEFCKIGNVTLDQCPVFPATSDYIRVNFGTFRPTKVWGAVLDFEPYCSVHAHLPFIGYVPLKMSDILPVAQSSGEVELIYDINLFTGDVVAKLYGKGVWGYKTLIGTYTGNCAFQIPFTGTNYGNYYKNILSGAANIVSSMFTGGLTAGSLVNSALDMATTNVPVQRSGAMTGGAAPLSALTAFLYVEYPVQSLAQDYNKIAGFASNYTAELGSLDGFSQIEELELSGFSGTDTEAEELKALLKDGVYF